MAAEDEEEGRTICTTQPASQASMRQCVAQLKPFEVQTV
jgi:hypothetical protein